MSVAVSPDGQWIASGSTDETVRIWSMSTLSEVHVLKGHSSRVRTVAFSPNSAFLFSGSDDKTVRVWNVQTGEAVGDALTGPTGDILSAVFSPGRLEFASGSQDGTLRIWDACARTDLALYKQIEDGYSELNEEKLRILWNVSRTSSTEAENDGWIRDGNKFLMWAPMQYRRDIKRGTKLVIGRPGTRTVRLEVDYRKVFRFSGTRWKDIYTGNGKGKEKEVSARR